jgi:hypothetical protein
MEGVWKQRTRTCVILNGVKDHSPKDAVWGRPYPLEEGKPLTDSIQRMVILHFVQDDTAAWFSFARLWFAQDF